MIIDLLNNAQLYHGVHPRLAQALKYLKETDLSAFLPGRFDIDGDDLYGLIIEYQTAPKEKSPWEAHRRYIDVQLMLKGQEMMGHAPIGALKVTKEYDETKDCLLLEGGGSYFTVKAGTFVVFGPQDGHQPGIMIGTPQPVKKAVLKVRV